MPWPKILEADRASRFWHFRSALADRMVVALKRGGDPAEPAFLNHTLTYVLKGASNLREQERE